MKQKFLSITFILIIFIFGFADILRSTDSIFEYVQKEGVSSETGSAIEASLQDNMYKKYMWIDIHGFIQRVLGRTVVEDEGSNTVFRLSSGAISTVESARSDKKIRKYADRMSRLKSGIPESTGLLYIQLPHKIQDDSELPDGVVSYANDSADRLLALLREDGIETLDIRELIKEEGLDWPSLFYKTDHHWRPQTAAWAADRISGYLSDVYGFNYDSSIYDPENMKTETFPGLFLGSAGRRTGSLYAGTDDFELVIPKDGGSFDFISYPGDTVIHRSGDFREAFIDEGNLEKDYYNINNYAAYTGDSTKMTISKNLSDPLNDKKILLIRDSYSCALQPFLSLSQAEITTIDLRYYRDDTVINHINKNDYDIVIVAYTAQSFDSQRFSFHKIPD